MTSWPWLTYSRTAVGVRPTRYSSGLISRGTPTRMSGSLGEDCCGVAGVLGHGVVGVDGVIRTPIHLPRTGAGGGSAQRSSGWAERRALMSPATGELLGGATPS